MQDLRTTPVQFTSSRWKLAALLTGSSVFVTIAVALPGAQSGSWRWMAGIFFGIGVLVFAFLLFLPQTLTLNSEGLTLAGGLMSKSQHYAWGDIDHFRIIRLGKSSKMIGLALRPHVARTTANHVSRRLSGADGGLPGSWKLSTAAMVDLLNEYLSQAHAQNTS